MTTNKQIAERIWHNCIHKNIGSFTLSQEKKAIKDIEHELDIIFDSRERKQELEIMAKVAHKPSKLKGLLKEYSCEFIKPKRTLRLNNETI